MQQKPVFELKFYWRKKELTFFPKIGKNADKI